MTANWLEKSDTSSVCKTVYKRCGASLAEVYLHRQLFCTVSVDASWQICWYLYLYSQQLSRLWRCNNPSKLQERERRGEEGGKSTHRSISVWVYTPQRTWVTYIHCECVCQECEETKLRLCELTEELAVTTYRLKNHNRLIWTSLFVTFLHSCNAGRDWSWSEAVSLLMCLLHRKEKHMTLLLSRKTPRPVLSRAHPESFNAAFLSFLPPP